MEQNKETATQNKQREAEVCREKKQTAWDKWKEDTLRKFNRTAVRLTAPYSNERRQAASELAKGNTNRLRNAK